jgi:hypothetical protein
MAASLLQAKERTVAAYMDEAMSKLREVHTAADPADPRGEARALIRLAARVAESFSRQHWLRMELESLASQAGIRDLFEPHGKAVA